MFVSLLALASLLAIQGSAHPFVASSSVPVHPRSNLVDQYRPRAHGGYTRSPSMKDVDGLKSSDYLDIATEFAKTVAPNTEFRVSNDHYVSKNGVAHVYLKQTVHDIDITNADMNINIDKNGNILSYGDSFFKGKSPSKFSSMDDFKSPVDALRSVRSKLNLPISGALGASTHEDSDRKFKLHGVVGAHQTPTAELIYFQTRDGQVKPAWAVSTDLYHNWHRTLVDAVDPSIVMSAKDYTNEDAKYQVHPWGCSDPDQCDREIVTNPWDQSSSPFGWQSDGTERYETTRGNNVIAQTLWSHNQTYLEQYRPEANNCQFIFPYPETQDFHSYANASVTQLFYTVNMYHDLLYDFGFDEAAGNFEINNHGEGGEDNDYVIASSQYAGSFNNAFFTTPPDGKPGRMNMFMYNVVKPWRDGAFDATIVIHEATHGVSNRLTGGKANGECLDSLEAGGMGEGWGDAMSNTVHIKSTDDRTVNLAHGAWANNDPAGNRGYLYSTNMTTNPLTFKDLNVINEVHDAGVVWATMLYDLLWDLVDEYGVDDAIRPTFDQDGVATNGRFLWIQLVVTGMTLQPCEPKFTQARDAILDADKAVTGGKNECLIWKAFARRGMGVDAESVDSEEFPPIKATPSFDVPANVC